MLTMSPPGYTASHWVLPPAPVQSNNPILPTGCLTKITPLVFFLIYLVKLKLEIYEEIYEEMAEIIEVRETTNLAGHPVHVPNTAQSHSLSSHGHLTTSHKFNPLFIMMESCIFMVSSHSCNYPIRRGVSSA